MSLSLRRLNPAILYKVSTNGSFRSAHGSTNIIDEIKEKSSDDAPVCDMTNPFEREKTTCILCKYNIVPDYKNVRLLSQFQSPYTGRIYGKHITRLCKEQQLRVETEIRKAQMAGLMGVVTKARSLLGDPKLFDPEHPIRPHKY